MAISADERLDALETRVPELSGRVQALVETQCKLLGGLDAFWNSAAGPRWSYAAHIASHLREVGGALSAAGMAAYLEVAARFEHAGEDPEPNVDD